MKPIRIEFVHSRAWVAVWCLTGLCMVGLAIVMGLQYKGLSDTRKAAQLSAIDLAGALRPAAVIPKPVDPRQSNYLLAANLLQNDLNRVFTLVEAIKEPNSRLNNLSVDAVSQQVRLEYDLGSVALATSVTMALNAGYNEPPWRLESISATGQTSPAGLPGIVKPASYRALWTARMTNL